MKRQLIILSLAIVTGLAGCGDYTVSKDNGSTACLPLHVKEMAGLNPYACAVRRSIDIFQVLCKDIARSD